MPDQTKNFENAIGKRIFQTRRKPRTDRQLVNWTAGWMNEWTDEYRWMAKRTLNGGTGAGYVLLCAAAANAACPLSDARMDNEAMTTRRVPEGRRGAGRGLALRRLCGSLCLPALSQLRPPSRSTHIFGLWHQKEKRQRGNRFSQLASRLAASAFN